MRQQTLIGTVLGLLLGLGSCSFNHVSINATVAVNGFYPDGNKLYVDHSIKLAPGTSASLDGEITLPADFNNAFTLNGHTVNAEFLIMPEYSESSEATTELTLDTTFNLGKQVIKAAGPFGGDYTVTLRFIEGQRASFSVPNSVYVKLSPNNTGGKGLRIHDAADHGVWVDIEGKAGSTVSLMYSAFRDLTEEEVYLAVTSTTERRYLLSDGSMVDSLTPFGASTTFSPGLVIDLSQISF